MNGERKILVSYWTFRAGWVKSFWALFLLAALHSSNEFDSALARSVG